MIAIRRLHHCALRTRDAAEASERWARLFGLTPAGEEAGRAILRCVDEAYGLELLEADVAGHDHTAFELDGAVTLADAERHLSRVGVASWREEGPCGWPEGVHCLDPAGHEVELVERAEPADPRPYVAKSGGAAPPHHPRRVQHVNFLVADIHALVGFYGEALGFRVSDWIGEGACWLHVDHDHHVWAALQQGEPHFHHVALELADFAAMGVALDHLAQFRRASTWGPGRHAMAQNLFAYVRMPEEDCFVELFCDMEQLARDHQPRHWPDDVHSSNAWGTLPPRTYFRFDEEAIRIEREQLVNLGKEFIPA